MSIALKHIKEYRFLNYVPGKTNFPADKLITANNPVSIQNQRINSIKRVAQIDSKAAFDKEVIQNQTIGKRLLKTKYTS